MKKILLYALCGGLAISGLPQKANAQFFKKLGKVLEQVDKQLGGSTGSTTTEKQTTTSTSSNVNEKSGMRIINPIENFTVEYKGITWEDDFVSVDFVMKNTGSQTLRIYQFEKMKTFDSDGREHASRSIIGNSVTTLGNGDFDFEPGVPVAGRYAIFNVPKTGAVMSLLQLRVSTFTPKTGYVDKFIEFRDVPITPPVVKAPTPVAAAANVTNTKYALILKDGVNVRKTASASGAIAGTTNKDVMFELEGTTNGFAKIFYKDGYAYVSLSMVNIITPSVIPANVFDKDYSSDEDGYLTMITEGKYVNVLFSRGRNAASYVGEWTQGSNWIKMYDISGMDNKMSYAERLQEVQEGPDDTYFPFIYDASGKRILFRSEVFK